MKSSLFLYYLAFFFLVFTPRVYSAYVMCNGQLCLDDCDHCDLCSPSSCVVTAANLKCRCASSSIPGSIALQNTPQFVFLSLRGGFKESFINQTDFTTTFLGNSTITDSIGGQIKPSLYITNDELDYNVANWFQKVGSLGFQSVTNKVSSETTNTQLKAEFDKGLGFLKTYGMIDTDSMRLVRNPSLQLADNWYQVLKGRQFTIDSSVIENPKERNATSRVWPYTLDYGVHTQTYCKENCPNTTYSGLWEFPIQGLYDENNKTITLYELPMDDMERSLSIVRQNFLDNYLTNRAPFGLTVDRDWFYMDAENVDMRKYTFLQQIYAWMGQLDSVIFAVEEEIINWIQDPKAFIISKPTFVQNKRKQIPLSDACGAIQTTFCDYPNDRSSLIACLLPNSDGNITCPDQYPNIRNESCGDGICVLGLDDCSCQDCGAVCRPNWPGNVTWAPYYESDTYMCGTAVFMNPINEAAMNFIMSARIYWGKLDKVIGAKFIEYDNCTLGCITSNWRIKPYLMSAFYPLNNYTNIQLCVNKTNSIFEADFVQLGIEVIASLLPSNATILEYEAECGNGICSEGERNLCDSDCKIPFFALWSQRMFLKAALILLVAFGLIL